MSFKERRKLSRPKIIKEDEESYECQPILKEFKTNNSPPTRASFKESFQCISRYTKSIYNLGKKQSFVNFLLKFTLGFIGGIILTYFCFMFLVFQLSVSLFRAAIFSSGIGILMTLGLIFSSKIRCLSFLIIPQFFSRIGRYTLTCYALILILTGPAANTLRNSQVLSQSMSCGQNLIQKNVQKFNKGNDPQGNVMNAVKTTIEKLRHVSDQLQATVLKLEKLVESVTNNIESSITWLGKASEICRQKFQAPKDRCVKALQQGISDCKAKLSSVSTWLCDVAYVKEALCYTITPMKSFCQSVNFNIGNFTEDVQIRFQHFFNNVNSMLHIVVHTEHPSNDFRVKLNDKVNFKGLWKAHDSDPILIWLFLSVGVTGIFFLLIIYRATYYQHMYETRTRFDNQYITRELQEINCKKLAENKPTVLPLNRLEKANYINATSIHLVASERLNLSRSVLFMTITTFKLMIHVVADYSLYWVLTTIQCLGPMRHCIRSASSTEEKAEISGQGPVAHLLKSVIDSLHVPSVNCDARPDPCLPNPYPPDFKRYFKIGFLIMLLWFLALFEPYGLRLRHLIMGFYKPERAKIRAQWLYGHILKSRGGFMKFARRKLHRTYKYSDQEKLTFRYWIQHHVPCNFVRVFLRCSPQKPQCILCAAKHSQSSELIMCDVSSCPGVYCAKCFKDMAQTCTVCKSPVEYGDLSDASLESMSDFSDSDQNIVIDGSEMQLNKKPEKVFKSIKRSKTLSDTELDDSDRNTQSLDLLQLEYEEKVKQLKKSPLNKNHKRFLKTAIHCIGTDCELNSLSSREDEKAVSSSKHSGFITHNVRKNCFKTLQKTSHGSNIDRLLKIRDEPSKTSVRLWNYRNINFDIFKRLYKALFVSYNKIERSNHGSIKITKHISDKSESKTSAKLHSFGPLRFFKSIWTKIQKSVPITRKPSQGKKANCKNIKINCAPKDFEIGTDSNTEDEITIFSRCDNNINSRRQLQSTTTQSTSCLKKKNIDFPINTETSKTDDFDDWWSAIIESGDIDPKKVASEINDKKTNTIEEKCSIIRGKNVTFFKPSSAISEVSNESMQ